MILRKAHHFCGGLAKRTEPQSNYEKISERPNLRDYKVTDQYSSKMSKSWKDKERQRNCYRLEDTKETWQLNAVWDQGLVLETEKGQK